MMTVFDYLNHNGPAALNQRDKVIYADTLRTLTDEELNTEYRTCQHRGKQDLILVELHRRMNGQS